MTTTTGPKRATRRRTTMALSKPHSKHQASLSFDAALALAYGLRAIGNASPQRPQESSITRRALELYARFLEGLTPDQLRIEGRAVAASSRPFEPSEADQQAAFERLDAVAPGLPLPELLEVRNGPSWVPLDVHALAAKVDDMVTEMYRSRFARKAVQA